MKPITQKQAVKIIERMIESCYGEDGEVSREQEYGTYRRGLLEALAIIKQVQQ